MRQLSLLTALFILATGGCVPVLIGGAFYHDAQKKKSREQFLIGFYQTNADRESNELVPLDLCTEKYHYDRAWARKDPTCRQRIDRYEDGDTTALQAGSSAQPVSTSASSRIDPNVDEGRRINGQGTLLELP